MSFNMTDCAHITDRFLPSSPFVAPWIKQGWHDRIKVQPVEPEDARIYGRTLVGPCWLWLGWNNGKGHGRVRIKGRGHYLHRHSLASFLGIEIYQLDTVDHLCPNRNCFNPLHVESVTPLENYERGKGPSYQFKTDAEYQADEALAAELRGY